MNAGAIPGLDITPEAALAKLAHVLSLPLRSTKNHPHTPIAKTGYSHNDFLVFEVYFPTGLDTDVATKPFFHIYEVFCQWIVLRSRKEQKELMEKNMRGEMSVKIQQVWIFSKISFHLIHASLWRHFPPGWPNHEQDVCVKRSKHGHHRGHRQKYETLFKVKLSMKISWTNN